VHLQVGRRHDGHGTEVPLVPAEGAPGDRAVDDGEEGEVDEVADWPEGCEGEDQGGLEGVGPEKVEGGEGEAEGEEGGADEGEVHVEHGGGGGAVVVIAVVVVQVLLCFGIARCERKGKKWKERREGGSEISSRQIVVKRMIVFTKMTTMMHDA